MATALPLPPDQAPILPPAPSFPSEPTSPIIEVSLDDFDGATALRASLPQLVAELHQAVSRAESYAHAAEALLNEVTLNSPAGPSRRTRRIVDHLTSSREANLRALELVEALTAELAPR